MLIYLNTNGYLAAWGKRGSISKELDKKVVVPGKKFHFLPTFFPETNLASSSQSFYSGGSLFCWVASFSLFFGTDPGGAKTRKKLWGLSSTSTFAKT